MDKKAKNLIIKSSGESKQTNIEEDYFADGEGIIEPYVSHQTLRSLYPANLYHQRAIKIKASLLSQVVSTNLDKFLPEGTNIKSFLYKFMLNAEVYGSAFLEKAGVSSNYFLYNMDTFKSRVDINHNTFQKVGSEHRAIEALHFKYESILSEYYGEPDYLAIIKQIATLHKADVYNDKFFDNGAKPELAIIFEDSDPTESQIGAITDFMKKDFRGHTNAHKTLVLTTGQGDGQTKPKIKMEQIGKVEDLSFKNLKEVGRDEIAAAHGVPPRLLGIIHGSALGGGGELVAQMKMFLKVTIEPKMKQVEWFFKQHGIDLELERFNIDDLSSPEDVAEELVKAGLITPIEKRNILG